MLTKLDRLLTGAVLVVVLLWSTQAMWKTILPSWLYQTAETMGVLLALPFCIYGGGGGSGTARVPLASEPVSESMRLPPRYRHRDRDNDKLIPVPKKVTKRSVSETLKKVVAARQQWLCDKCLIILPPHFEVDHIVSLADGGSNEPSNLRALCRECHGWKSVNDRLRWNGEI